MYADSISFEDPVLATESVRLQPVLSQTEALGCRACRTRSRASPRDGRTEGSRVPSHAVVQGNDGESRVALSI